MQNIETLCTICIYLYEFKLKNLNWNQNSEIELMLNFFARVFRSEENVFDQSRIWYNKYVVSSTQLRFSSSLFRTKDDDVFRAIACS